MNLTQTIQRMLMIELNESSVDLLNRRVDELGLADVQRLLAMRASQTTTADQLEYRGVDPWVHWVSADTDVSSLVHGITHPGNWVDFRDELHGDVTDHESGRDIKFFGHFEAIVARTGGHVRNGDLLSNGVPMPETMYNRGVAGWALTYFNVTAPQVQLDLNAAPQNSLVSQPGAVRADA